MIGIDFILSCAPAFAPETIEQIIKVESSGNPLAIHVNKGKLDRMPSNIDEAVNMVVSYLQKGYSVDLGLMQVNSKNIERLGYSVKDMFEPCKNIAAGSRILFEFYESARTKNENEQTALLWALSAYNTGNFTDGFMNGYVSRYSQVLPNQLAKLSIVNPFTADTAVQLNFQREAEMIINKEQVTPVVSQLTDDAGVPGVQVEYTPEDADNNGAFEETALSEQDAWEANADISFDPESTGIVIGGKTISRGDN